MSSRFLSKRATVSPSSDAFGVLLAQARAKGHELLDLTLSNPTRAELPYERRLIESLVRPGALDYAADPLGNRGAREYLVGRYAETGIRTRADHMLLTASTSEAYSFLFKLLCDPGDEVLVPEPSYPLLDELARYDSVNLTRYQLAYDGAWHLDLESVKRAVTQKTRALCVISPNNPTGYCLTQEEYNTLSHLGLPIICDEVFAPYTRKRPHLSILQMAAACPHPVLSFALEGLSKTLGLPQLKLAWCVASGPEEQVNSAMHALEFIADTYLSVATPVQLALPQLFSEGLPVQRAIVQRLADNQAFLEQHAKGSACTVLSSQGGWSAVLQLPAVLSEEEWCLKLLTQAKLAVQPGWLYDLQLEPAIVCSLLTPSAQFETGILRLLKCVDSVVG